jgi:hypothetical protein
MCFKQLNSTNNMLCCTWRVHSEQTIVVLFFFLFLLLWWLAKHKWSVNHYSTWSRDPPNPPSTSTNALPKQNSSRKKVPSTLMIPWFPFQRNGIQTWLTCFNTIAPPLDSISTSFLSGVIPSKYVNAMTRGIQDKWSGLFLSKCEEKNPCQCYHTSARTLTTWSTDCCVCSCASASCRHFCVHGVLLPAVIDNRGMTS